MLCMCSETVAANQHDTIQSFIQGTVADGAPVLPISAQLKYNVDAVCEYIVKKIPVPKRDFISPPQMIVIRSFDVNKPGSEVEELQGGVAGGSILQVPAAACVVRRACASCNAAGSAASSNHAAQNHSLPPIRPPQSSGDSLSACTSTKFLEVGHCARALLCMVTSIVTFRV